MFAAAVEKVAITDPGDYKWGRGRPVKDHLALVSPEEALRVAMRITGKSAEQVTWYVSALLWLLFRVNLTPSSKARAFHAERILKYNNALRDSRPNGYPRVPGYTRWVHMDSFEDNHLRFTCMVGLPWLSSRCEKAQWGLACHACQLAERMNVLHAPDEVKTKKAKLYSMAGFVQHLTECPDARQRLQEYFEKLSRFPLNRLLPVSSRHDCNLAGEFPRREPERCHRYR